MAARYQVSVRTIDYWCADRILPYYKRGGVVRFHPDECDAAMKNFRSKSRLETAEANEEKGEEL